ncbi:9801_t:CDS:2 [Racocetra fulgida]|uniref:9801_t:CDS:1 n=1 Tax=Racocetra fulgida TaxID=60492 RepID=A0A9N9A906_9GLOM|nr:9801_t:CDS:2 [Racocetra fulgida]
MKRKKLQELIRRGTPADLEEANELMKVMAGYDPEVKPDYKKQAGEELERIQRKAILLNDMLNNVKPGEVIGEGDIFEELSQACKAVQPKIQKFISEEEDSESIVLKKYQNILNGVFNDPNDELPPPPPPSTTQPESSWLIDLGDPEPQKGQIQITGDLIDASGGSSNNNDQPKTDEVKVIVVATLSCRRSKVLIFFYYYLESGCSVYKIERRKSNTNLNKFFTIRETQLAIWT